MDWKTYRRQGVDRSRGRYPRAESEPAFEFLPVQGPGRRFNYVPGKIVVPSRTSAKVKKFLEGKGFHEIDSSRGLHLYYSEQYVPPAEFIQLIEDANNLGGADSHVAPLHAFTAQDHGDLGAAGTPVPAEPLNLANPALATGYLPGEGVNIALLDTGAYLAHPMLAGHLDPDSEAEDIVFDPTTGHLKRQVGHGSAGAGVVRRCAPGATIFARKVLDSNGKTDDLALAQALREIGPKVDIVCLPLGGYTMNDRGPDSVLTILDTLYAGNEDFVVVSASGNNGRGEPFWPAADERVIGVGALDENGERAGYSNYGDWVDTYALGTGIQSAFVEWEKSKTPPPQTIAGEGPDEAAERQQLIREMDDHVKNNHGPWATWSGTSFATSAVAGTIAAAMRPSGKPEKTAREAAFDAVRDGRLPRLTTSASRTAHTFII